MALVRSGVRALGGIDAAAEDDADGIQKDEDIEEEAHVLHVIEVVLELAPGILDGGAVGVIDLGPAGDAGLDHEPLLVVGDGGGELLDDLRPLGTGADEGHVRP